MSRLPTALIAFLVAFPGAATAQDLWLSNARLIDGRPGTAVRSVNLRVSDGRITEITPAADRPGAIDLHGAFLLPGFIDLHTHIEDPAAARRALSSGVTTTRVLGDNYLKGMATRDLVRNGRVAGPQMLVSGGHVRPQLGESFILSYPQFGQYLEAPLKGPDQVAEVVRAVIDRGADVIKVGASERAGLARTDPRRQELSYDELRAAVAEAAKNGLHVAAHAHDRQGANAAVRAGVRSIEHGTYLTDETLQLMAKQGTFFDPTADIVNDLAEAGGDYDNAGLKRRGEMMQPVLIGAIQRALKMGVKIVTGSDTAYGPTSIARVSREAGMLVSAGLTPLQALQAATVTSAELLRIEKQVGVVENGFEADLLVVDGNPLDNIRTLLDPVLVISNGRIGLDRLSFGKDK